MKIRSVTWFCNPGWPLDDHVLKQGFDLLADARSAYEALGYEVQTTRLATIPFPLLLGEQAIRQAPDLAKKLETALKGSGVGYAALGPALPEVPASYEIIPDAIASTQSVFFSGIMADRQRGISLPAVKACAEVIVRCSGLSPDGFANLRFAALANVEPGTPFLPASYHHGDQPAFSIGTEAMDLAVEAFQFADSIADARQKLIISIEDHASKLVSVADRLQKKHTAIFNGIDFSLAPFPKQSRSLEAALTALGVDHVGGLGSLTGVALLTEAIQTARFPHTGFCGVMLPVMEDASLAERAAGGLLTVRDLLLYSSVCGTGLDTIPLPGDVTAGQLAPLLLDLSSMALRLDKSLTARLMPIPGKKAGDATGFDFSYFANSRVMALDSDPLNSPLGGNETFPLSARNERK